MNKNDINIIIDQQLPPADSAKLAKGTAYYAEILKDLKTNKESSPEEKPEDKKSL